MALTKRAPRPKTMVVYSPEGKKQVMTVPNARDAIQHLGWTQQKPVIVYRDKKEIEDEEEEPVSAEEDDSEGQDSSDEEVAEEDEEVAELLDEPDPDDAEFDLPVITNPYTMSKDAIVKYAEEHFSTTLDKRQTQPKLAGELDKMIKSMT